MVGKIARLTNAQLSELSAIRAQWTDIEALTLAADHGAAEEGVARAYRAAGLAPPQKVLWMADPALGTRVAAILEQYGDDTAELV